MYIPRFELVERSKRLRVVGGKVEQFLERKEIRVPTTVLEGVQDELLGLGERAELLSLREVRSHRLVDED